MRGGSIAAALLAAFALRAEVVTYPAPPGIPASSHYAVRLTQAGKPRDAFVYMIRSQWRTNGDKTSSFTTFSFSGAVENQKRSER